MKLPAMAMAKTAVKSAARLDLRAGMDAEVGLFALCFSGEGKPEGVHTFFEKCQPEFKGH
jgi:enoyl-CoA hydratase/carnithine racemase